MKKAWGLLLAAILVALLQLPVSAHVANEKTIYDDIAYSKAMEQIVYLRGVNAIAYESGANLFRPHAKLSRADLAFWAAAFKKLGDENAKKEDLQKLALDKGLVDSLDGNATVADVNKAYFNGKAPADNPTEELTHEGFAEYLGTFLTQPVDGKTLFDMAGFTKGPSGKIDDVQVATSGEGEQKFNVYTFTIGGKAYKIDEHPKVLYGPVDLSQWKGKQLEETWMVSENGNPVITLLKSPKGQFTEDQIASTDDGDGDSGSDGSAAKQAFPWVPVIGGVIVVLILLWLLVRRKK